MNCCCRHNAALNGNRELRSENISVHLKSKHHQEKELFLNLISTRVGPHIVALKDMNWLVLKHLPKQKRRHCALWLIFIIFASHYFWLSSALHSPIKTSFQQTQRLRRSSYSNLPEGQRCERIEIVMCQDIGYNFTDMKLSPTNMNKQSEAAPTVKEFSLLVDSKCSDMMRMLVCSIYTPICLSNYSQFLPPCRHICEEARRGCEPLMTQYHHPWPEMFRCEKFPVYSSGSQLCLHLNRSTDGSSTSGHTQSLRLSGTVQSSNKGDQLVNKSKLSNAPRRLEANQECRCLPPMVIVTEADDPLYDKVTTGRSSNCAFPCKSPYFNKEELSLAMTWITVCSVLCFIVTLSTVATFLVDVNRFKYPERPIIFISTCYMFVSMGFLIRVVAGHEAVACDWGSDRVLYGSTGPFLCSAVFLLIYFFGMAGALWWVVLTLTWFMAAGLKWGNEAIAFRSKYFHLVSWFIPGLQCVVVLATSSVDGDALAGICYVGNRDVVTLLRFVILPLTTFLVMGGMFLFLGFINLFHIRSSMKNVGEVTLPLDKLIVRIGSFSLIIMGLSATLVACHFYEERNRYKWEEAHNCRLLSPAGDAVEPQLAVSLAKYSITMLIGVANGWWICSSKTFQSWRRFYLQFSSYVCGRTVLAAWFKQKKKKSFPNSAPNANAELQNNFSSLEAGNDYWLRSSRQEYSTYRNQSGM